MQQWGLTIGDLPFKYLGVPLSTKKLSTLQWYPLIEKIISKISTWTAKKLTYAGRVQLVQSVLFGVQSYWTQLFLIPSKILKLIDGYCRSFIWSGANVITKKSRVLGKNVLPYLSWWSELNTTSKMEPCSSDKVMLGPSSQRR